MTTSFLPPTLKKYNFKPSAWWENFPKNPKLLESEFGVIRFPIDRGEEFPVDKTILAAFLERVKKDKILEYGVGMGGNIVVLSHIFKEVYGYDTPGMIAALQAIAPKLSNLSSDFDMVSARRYDAIIDITCWQHMEGHELIYCLKEMSYCTPYALSFTRCYNDPTRMNIVSLVEASNAWVLELCSIDMNIAQRVVDETHFSVLYKSVNYTSAEI